MARKTTLLQSLEPTRVVPVTNKYRRSVTIAVIDYPQEGEQIRPGYYAVRISVPQASEVQVSINSGNWQDCRPAVGYFWFDWQASASGKYRIIARARTSGENWVKSDIRICTVGRN